MKDIPRVMKGVQLTGHGGLEKLVYHDDIPVPAPGPRDVLIRVGAAAVNSTDLNTRLGWYSKADGEASDASWSGSPLEFPRIQGADVCGEVVACGERVAPGYMNSRVLVEPYIRVADGRALDQPWYFRSECDGGFAEYTVIAARHAQRINSTLSDVELASFPCLYSTAENLLTRANVGAGYFVLVTGVSGGVGSGGRSTRHGKKRRGHRNHLAVQGAEDRRPRGSAHDRERNHGAGAHALACPAPAGLIPHVPGSSRLRPYPFGLGSPGHGSEGHQNDSCLVRNPSVRGER